MPHIVWLTTDDIRDEFADDVNQGVAAIGGTLHTVFDITDLRYRPIDVLLWYDPEADEQKFAVLRELCPRVVIFVKRNEHQTRLCPFRSVGAPRYYIVLPFDAEDFEVIVQGVLRRPVSEYKE